jgi:hypothetical protein
MVEISAWTIKGKARFAALREAIVADDVALTDRLLRVSIVDDPQDPKAWINLATLNHKLGQTLLARLRVARAGILTNERSLTLKIKALRAKLAANRDLPFVDVSRPDMANVLPRLHYLTDTRRRMCLVYQPGRVGSTAVHAVLERSMPAHSEGTRPLFPTDRDQ